MTAAIVFLAFVMGLVIGLLWGSYGQFRYDLKCVEEGKDLDFRNK